ncbi:MAG: tetratricopeptide repeat protein [Clostridia bacterium]|nr:tetratricopeptide repeat protein [Clostridia bacterium]
MKKIYTAISNNRFVSFIILALLLCGIYSCIMLNIDASLWILIVGNMLILLFAYVFPYSCTTKLLQAVVDELNNNCDPYPLLDETRRQLERVKEGSEQQLLMTNQCAALISIGEYQKGIDLLTSINIDKYSTTPAILKFIYYNNLASCYWHIDDIENAVTLNKKAIAIYNDLPDTKEKHFFTYAVKDCQASVLFSEGKYDEALKLLEEAPIENASARISNTYARAEIYMKKGEIEIARNLLNYVIANGNKLYSVVRAKEMLEKHQG